MSTINNDKTFQLDIKQIEHDAIIECMKIEIELLEAKLKQATAIKQKLLHECDCSNFGEVIFNKYGCSYMKPIINETKNIDSPFFQFALRIVPSIFAVYAGGGGLSFFKPKSYLI